MGNIQRDDIRIISKYSKLTEATIARAFEEQVHNNKQGWQRFFRVLLISLGIGFTVAGIIFFFAYNWDALHKFVKIGLIGGLLVIASTAALITHLQTLTGKIVLTGAAVLVGVLFAVFGQVYQTGANAYDFFLAWTVFVTIWVLTINFAPLWLLWLILLDTTISLYANQVASHWSGMILYTLLFFIAAAATIIVTLLARSKYANPPGWLQNILALWAISYATMAVLAGIFEGFTQGFLVTIIATILLFALGIRFGLKNRKGLYLASIPFAVIVIIAGWLIRSLEDAGMYLLVSLFIVGSITLVIKKLIDIQKQWDNEKQG